MRRVLLDRLVGLSRPGVEIAERVGGGPVARLVFDDADVFGDCRVEPPLAE